MILVVKDSGGTTGPGTWLWPLTTHPGRILAFLGGSHPLPLLGRKPVRNDPVRARLMCYLILSDSQPGFLLVAEKKTFVVNKNTAFPKLLQGVSADIYSAAEETCPGPLTEKTIYSQEIKLLKDEKLI